MSGFLIITALRMLPIKSSAIHVYLYTFKCKSCWNWRMNTSYYESLDKMKFYKSTINKYDIKLLIWQQTLVTEETLGIFHHGGISSRYKCRTLKWWNLWINFSFEGKYMNTNTFKRSLRNPSSETLYDRKIALWYCPLNMYCIFINTQNQST